MKFETGILSCALLLISNHALSGQGWYITFKNSTDREVTIKQAGETCWYWNDLKDMTIRPMTSITVYTEAKNSSPCGGKKSIAGIDLSAYGKTTHIEFKGNAGDFNSKIIKTIRCGNDNQWVGVDRELPAGSGLNISCSPGDQEKATIEVYPIYFKSPLGDGENWEQKSIDYTQGYVTPFGPICQTEVPLLGGMNRWICEDMYRYGFIMDPWKIGAIEVLPGQGWLPDGRFIYVYRTTDNKFFIRRYDRNDDKNKDCNDYYNKFKFIGNRGEHVRHSQLNGGWDPVWAAGELKIENGVVTKINNESGHFKPTERNVGQAKDFLIKTGHASWKIQAGTYKDVPIELTNNECKQLSNMITTTTPQNPFGTK